MNIGIIGCGNISTIYMKNISAFEHLHLKACADLDVKRAQTQAEKFQISKVYTVDEMLADSEIDLIINLTIPGAHAKVAIDILNAGKHVYIEKPLAISREDAQQILVVAKENNVLVGAAPDTFLGSGIQTAIKLINEGAIGTPIGASAFMIGRGPEHWHPDPSFFYKEGGGPMFDMGPYYLTALIALLGPIKRIAGSTRISYPQRKILSEAYFGQEITVDVPTHISGTIDFVSGAIASMTTSFDSFGGSSLPPIEIYGSEGTLILPDPNFFNGTVQLRKRDETDFVQMPSIPSFASHDRGIGVANMVDAIRQNKAHLANGDLAYHVLEAMHGFHDSSSSGTYYDMKSTCEKPAQFPIDMK